MKHACGDVLMLRCDGCGAETVSELARWWRFHSSGEVWFETCSGCRTVYTVELRLRVNRAATVAHRSR